MLNTSFRGSTDRAHVEDGVVITFDRSLPNQWEKKTTIYVVHPSGTETTFTNEEMTTPNIFAFKPTIWATLNVNLVKFEAAKLRVEIVGSIKQPHIDLAPPEA